MPVVIIAIRSDSHLECWTRLGAFLPPLSVRNAAVDIVSAFDLVVCARVAATKSTVCFTQVNPRSPLPPHSSDWADCLQRRVVSFRRAFRAGPLRVVLCTLRQSTPLAVGSNEGTARSYAIAVQVGGPLGQDVPGVSSILHCLHRRFSRFLHASSRLCG